jgi:hypothetical protein
MVFVGEEEEKEEEEGIKLSVEWVCYSRLEVYMCPSVIILVLLYTKRQPPTDMTTI